MNLTCPSTLRVLFNLFLWFLKSSTTSATVGLSILAPNSDFHQQRTHARGHIVAADDCHYHSLAERYPSDQQHLMISAESREVTSSLSVRGVTSRGRVTA